MSNIFLEIRAGTGGEDSNIFVQELEKMYCKYLEKQKQRFEINQRTKSTCKILIKNPTCKLHLESGVHRIQRVPPTETRGRIHTSTVTVAVMPEVRTSVPFYLNPKDLDIQNTRGGGKGGQNRNKVETAVIITHKPTGLQIKCEEHRTQYENKKAGIERIRQKLIDQVYEKIRAEFDSTRRAQIGTGDRNEKIRTYNWKENRVTDHRNGKKVSLTSVFNGGLDLLYE